jgi:UDP-N-acetylglucosamine 1-carboxyvinyltransferase
MDVLQITGGVPLRGSVSASGAKNAALPILAASILASDTVMLENVPDLADVRTMALVLGYLGVEVASLGGGRLRIDTVDPSPVQADRDLVGRMRASFCVLGPLLARRGQAVVALPGGCNIGTRPVDLHLKGLAALGADLRIAGGYVVATARRLRGARIDLTGPHGSTVTGTANVMAAATLAQGATVLVGAAREPEIVDLGRCLISQGARIDGLGTSMLEIRGVDALGGTAYRIIPDRIEAATLLLAGAITGGSVTVTRVVPGHLQCVLSILHRAGCQVVCGPDWISIIGRHRPQPLPLCTGPYPQLPTDLQSQLMAWLSLADGSSRIVDTVFPDRFTHVGQLQRLGARILRRGPAATVRGVARLAGTTVMANDLRAGAALVLAGLAAEGDTTVGQIHHLDRGYERLERKLQGLGACIQRRPEVNAVAHAGLMESLDCAMLASESRSPMH